MNLVGLESTPQKRWVPQIGLYATLATVSPFVANYSWSGIWVLSLFRSLFEFFLLYKNIFPGLETSVVRNGTSGQPKVFNNIFISSIRDFRNFGFIEI